MSVAARRIRAGDVILAAGSLLLLASILAHVAAAPAAPPSGPAPREPGRISEGVPDGLAMLEAMASPFQDPATSRDGSNEPPPFVPNSKTIRSWKDLPNHFVHRPYWVSRREHPRTPNGNGIDVKLRNAELHLELLGYDADSIRFAFDLVNRLDAALTKDREGADAASRLLELAQGGGEAADLAAAIGDGADEEAIRVRAIALLATHAGAAGVTDRLVALAGSETSGTIRTAAGVSLLWMGRQSEVARWVSSEGSSKVMADFFDSVQVGVNRMDAKSPPKSLVFGQARAVESPALVDALMEGSAAARWDGATRAKIYSIAAQYGGERPEVGAWMEREYAKASDDLTRASILFAAPRVAHSGGLEEKAIEVARSGASGYVVRTALFSLSQFRTERSLRVLMEVAPKCGEDTAAHAIRSLERLAPWFGREIEPYLKSLAGHPDPKLRALAAAALARTFTTTAR